MPPQRSKTPEQAAMVQSLKVSSVCTFDFWYFILIWYCGIGDEVVINVVFGVGSE